MRFIEIKPGTWIDPAAVVAVEFVTESTTPTWAAPSTQNTFDESGADVVFVRTAEITLTSGQRMALTQKEYQRLPMEWELPGWIA